MFFLKCFKHSFYNIKMHTIFSIPPIAYEILEYSSFFDLDNIFFLFKLSPKLQQKIKDKIYKQRLIETIYRDCFYYTIEGILHREDDQPVKIYCMQSLNWYKNGKLHRDADLPAIECLDGSKTWYVNDLRHRDADLPAVEYYNGDKEWYYNGILHRAGDLPARIFMGRKEYWINGSQHRDGDLPAVESLNGHKEWWLNGKLHRENGPAIISTNGTLKWYYNGKLQKPSLFSSCILL